MITLRPYQRTALDAIYSYYEFKDGNALISAPTGSGKSLLIAAFCQEVLQKYPDQRILILTHVRELVAQNHEKLMSLWPEAPAGIYSASLKRRQFHHPLTFATVQSVYKKPALLGHRDIIIIDEVHLLSRNDSGMYNQLISELKKINPVLKLIGMSATPYRLDSGLLHEGEDRIFTDLIVDIPILDLVHDGYLSPLISRVSTIQANMGNVKLTAGEFNALQMEKVFTENSFSTHYLDEIKKLTEDRKSILIFCCGIDHANEVAEGLNQRGIQTETLSHKNTTQERDDVIGRFKNGKLRCIASMNILTTGFDAPNVDCIVLLRATMSPGLYCLSEDTEVLTSAGFKGINDIKEEYMAASPHIDNLKMEWSPIKSIIKRNLYPHESMATYESPRLSINVTNTHSMIYRNKGGSKNRFFCDAEKLLSKKAEFFIPVSAFTQLPDFEELSDNDISFIGWFLTDGTLNKKTKAIQIGQSFANYKYIEEIESILDKCNFKYGICINNKPTNFSNEENLPRVLFSISFGKPRGADKHKTGWSRLEKYIDKDFPEVLFNLSERQIDILLTALNNGNGNKHKPKDWTPRSYHICTGNKNFADRLQILLITNGWSCNVTSDGKNRKNIIYIMHIKKRYESMIGGTGYKDRPTFRREENKGQKVWCVETKNNTLITRRNGKVAILGNCQMVGRGCRIAPGKTNCLVLDHGANIMRHGSVADVIAPTGKRPRKQIDEDSEESKVKICQFCRSAHPLGAIECNVCGQSMIVERDLTKNIEDKPSDLDIMAPPKPVLPEWETVDSIDYKLHKKEGKPDSMRVEYNCGFMTYREWILIEHQGFPRQKSERWWFRRMSGDLPKTTGEALRAAYNLKKPTRILVKKTGKYWEILDYDFTVRNGVAHDGTTPKKTITQSHIGHTGQKELPDLRVL